MAESSLSATNDKLVRDFLLCWERRETEKVVAACTDDAIWHFRPLEPIVGRQAIRSFVERYADTPGARMTSSTRWPLREWS